MAEAAEAREVVLRSTKPLAPPFHRHIAKAKLQGRTCQTGDTVVIYQVVNTDPPGLVQVTQKTLLRFE